MIVKAKTQIQKERYKRKVGQLNLNCNALACLVEKRNLLASILARILLDPSLSKPVMEGQCHTAQSSRSDCYPAVSHLRQLSS